jgi:hypothetical protein
MSATYSAEVAALRLLRRVGSHPVVLAPPPLRDTLGRLPADAFWRLGHDGCGPDPSIFLAEVMVSRPGFEFLHCQQGATPEEALHRAAEHLLSALTGLGHA